MTGIHGINHTTRVLFLVELLAALENLVEPERDMLSKAAVYHDIGRVHDDMVVTALARLRSWV